MEIEKTLSELCQQRDKIEAAIKALIALKSDEVKSIQPTKTVKKMRRDRAKSHELRKEILSELGIKPSTCWELSQKLNRHYGAIYDSLNVLRSRASIVKTNTRRRNGDRGGYIWELKQVSQ